MLLSEVIASFLSWAAGRLAVGTVSGYKRHLDKFAAAVGDQAAAELRAHHLLTWGKTWHQLQAVQRCFAWACTSAELIARNPFSNIERPPLGVRRRTLSRVQLARLIRGAAADFRRLLIAARESIARPQELRALRWEQLHHDAQRGGLAGELAAGRAVFVLTEFKGRKRRADPHALRIIPVPPRLGRMLARLLPPAGQAGGHVLLTRKGRPWTKEAVRLRMQRLRARVGLGPDERGERVCLYTLRHTAATEAAAAGVRDRLLAELMGHASTRTTARYQHLELMHIVAAMAQVTEARKKKRPGSH